MNTEQKAALDRLERIPWEECGHVAANRSLPGYWCSFAENMRTICDAHQLDAGLAKNMSVFFGAVGNLVGPDRDERYFEIAVRVLADRYRWRGKEYAAFALAGFLIWDALTNDKKAWAWGSPRADNPHLALIMFFENGGAFCTEHGMLDRVLPDIDNKPRSAQSGIRE